MKIKVKICGVTRPSDARMAAEFGADFVGVVMAPGSSRHTGVDRLRSVAAAAGPALPVLVCRGMPVRDVIRAARAAGIRRVQPHGVDRSFLAALRREGLIVHRVVRVPPGSSRLPRLPEPQPGGLTVLDGGDGGEGRRFDWDLLAGGAPRRTFIAGGVCPGNVPRLVRYRPFGVDLSSGVESAPGIKDRELVARLFAAIGGAE